MEYVIIAVECVTKWAEAEVTRDASPKTAADFLYTRIVCRYSCIQSLQLDNGPHFVNPMLRCLTRLLKIVTTFQLHITHKAMVELNELLAH